MRQMIAGSMLLGLMAGCSQVNQSEPQVAEGSACTPQVVEDGAKLHEKVYAAQPAYREVFRARALTTKETAGAKLYVAAESGMSQAYLHRAAACHAAATTPADNPNDPLRPTGGVESVKVAPQHGSYVIAVTSSDEKVGQEIWNRAQALQAQGSVKVKQVAQASDRPKHL